MSSDPSNLASLRRVARTTTRFLGTTMPAIRHGRRTKRDSFHRYLCMYLIRRHTGCSLCEIGDYFGGGDSTGILFHIRCMARQIGKDPDTRRLAEQLDEILCCPDLEDVRPLRRAQRDRRRRSSQPVGGGDEFVRRGGGEGGHG